MEERRFMKGKIWPCKGKENRTRKRENWVRLEEKEKKQEREMCC